MLLAADFLGVTAGTDSQQLQVQGEDRFFCCHFIKYKCAKDCIGNYCDLPCKGVCGIFKLYTCGPDKCEDVAPHHCIKRSTTKTSTTTTSTITTSTTTT